jgi:mannose-6-phosphate isomerase-like protein (cupin superfamily)
MSSPGIQLNRHVYFRALGTTYRVLSPSLNGSAAIVEHTLKPKSLGAPMHKHTHEDEISYVLEGELSVIQDGVEQVAYAGQYVVKPRGVFHTFWNATDKPLRFIEFIVPGNFSNYFAELEPFLPEGKPPVIDKVRETAAKYGLIVDPLAANAIIEKYGLNPLG